MGRGPHSSARGVWREGARSLDSDCRTWPSGCSGNPSPAELANLAAPSQPYHTPRGVLAHPSFHRHRQDTHFLTQAALAGTSPASSGPALAGPTAAWGLVAPERGSGALGVKRGRQAGLRRGEAPLGPLRPVPVPTLRPRDHTAAGRSPQPRTPAQRWVIGGLSDHVNVTPLRRPRAL